MVVSFRAAESPLSAVPWALLPQCIGSAPNRATSAGSMPPSRGLRTTHCLRASVALLPLKCFSVVWHRKPTSQLPPSVRLRRSNAVSHFRSGAVTEYVGTVPQVASLATVPRSPLPAVTVRTARTGRLPTWVRAQRVVVAPSKVPPS